MQCFFWCFGPNFSGVGAWNLYTGSTTMMLTNNWIAKLKHCIAQWRHKGLHQVMQMYTHRYKVTKVVETQNTESGDAYAAEQCFSTFFGLRSIFSNKISDGTLCCAGTSWTTGRNCIALRSVNSRACSILRFMELSGSPVFHLGQVENHCCVWGKDIGTIDGYEERIRGYIASDEEALRRQVWAQDVKKMKSYVRSWSPDTNASAGTGSHHQLGLKLFVLSQVLHDNDQTIAIVNWIAFFKHISRFCVETSG